MNPASTVARALPTPLSASWAALRSIAGIPAPWSSPTRWVWQSISPSSVCPGRSTPALGRRLARAEHALDPFPPHQQPPSLEDLAGLHVDQPCPRLPASHRPPPRPPPSLLASAP